jgi:membrane fusion protein (multidrug efflux system)
VKRYEALRFHPLLFALAATTVLSGCGKTQAPQSPPPQQVGIVTLVAQPVTLVRELQGRTNAFLVAEVRPQVSGIVVKRFFTEGGIVKAGEPLYQLDDRTYRADHASARAAVEKAEAALQTARVNARRFAELVDTGAISAQDNENAQATLRQAQADLESAKASVDSARVRLAHARITAPITGRIGRSSVTQGALVTQNQETALATIQQLDPIYVDVNQSSTELLQLRRQIQAGTLRGTDDMPVKVLLEDGSAYAHTGKLQFAELTVDEATGSFAMRVVVPNPDNLLLPGMYVRAVLDVGVRPQGLLVPQQGIARDPKGNATALVVGNGDTVEQRVVQANRTIGDKWLVDAGLAPGDRVIVEGVQKAQPGARVQPVEVAVAASTAASAKPADAR